MSPISLALFWHQHQPYYPDDVSGENLMPWVRLHGTKDYYGMALHLRAVPEFRCTVNLVPSLLLQLQAYTDQQRSDRHLDVSRMPADGLSQADGCYLLDNFFMANVDNMIRPYPRYYDLYLKRGFSIDTADTALPRFGERELRDLQVWSNLTWIHPLVFDEDSELREFRDKGQSWTEDEKQWLLDKQLEILGRVIPLHRELMESGQIELTTTPFFHPILPLLWDKHSAREAMPGCALPRHLDSYAEDARIHLQRAVEYHAGLFGAPPRGLWPSEGSVSQDILEAIADVGIEWIATDEEILSQSTNGWVSRDEHGHLRNSEMLYRPWSVGTAGQRLQILFRDHALSDLIGFQYQRSDPRHAAGDLLGKLESIARGVDGKMSGRPALVPIILDGENCWEYYPDGGVEFLRTLYQTLAAHPTIRPQRVSDYLDAHPASDQLSRLFAGSWIAHDFAIWIGHAEDVKAWELLHQAREFVKAQAATGEVSAEKLRRAWEEIYIAEGSDWYWWFGEDHSSALDSLFDQLFRKHLQNVYTLLGATYPGVLNHPITQGAQLRLHTWPTGFLPVKVDGHCTYFEWASAAHYVSGSERGTMTQVTTGLLREVYFGFDATRLFVRIDTARRAVDELASLAELRLTFHAPLETEIRLTGFARRSVRGALYRHGRRVRGAVVDAAVDRVLEVAVAFKDLQCEADDVLHFYVEARSQTQSVDRVPREGALELTVPSEDFEMVMWQA